MYRKHVNQIIDICEAKQSVLPVVTFTLCTIQAGLSTCLDQITDVNKHGASSRFMWGQKGKGYTYTQAHDAYLWGKVNHIKETLGTRSQAAAVAAIELFLPIPNLGMVKAAFVAQQLGFNVACIDSHNLVRLGLEAKHVKLGKVKPETARRKVQAYVAMTQEKGSAYWWNSWCKYVAGNKANRKLDTGAAVSAYHVTCVNAVIV